MSEELSYAKTGVSRELRAKSKESLKLLQQTYRFSPYGAILQLPFGKIFPINTNRYLDLVIEGVGTKVLLAQLADKYDTIGIDGVAMAVNDVIRSGATPLAIADNIHAYKSDPALVVALIKGIVDGAAASQCMVAGGEIGDVAEIIKGCKAGKGFDLVVSCIGEVEKHHIIHGNTIQPEDLVIGLRSSGLHSNGITLARRVLFKEWGGRYDPYETLDGLDSELIFEALKPTEIYAKPLQEILGQHKVKGALHITGNAYLKFSEFSKFSKGIGFTIDNIKPQPIFKLLQKTAKLYGGIKDEELLKTFNMGWGFALVIDRDEGDEIISLLEKNGVEAEVIGKATSTPKIQVVYREKKLVLN